MRPGFRDNTEHLRRAFLESLGESGFVEGKNLNIKHCCG
jgi:hypothetical protein